MGRGPVLGVLSGCGGAGASVFAAALALRASEQPALATLVDCDPLGGGIDVLLGCEKTPGPRWGQLRLRGGLLDPAALLEGLPHWQGVAFLATDTAEELDPGALSQVVDAAAEAGPVVLDLPRWPSPVRSVGLARCDHTVLVSAAEVRAATASVLVAAGLDPTRSCVVVRGSSRQLPAGRIASLLGLPLAGRLPYDPASLRSAGLSNARFRAGTRRVADAVLRRGSADEVAA